MAEAARAYALLSGRPTVGFDDVKAVASPTLNHRLVLNYKARFDGVSSLSIIAKLIERMDETGIKLPRDVQIEA
jgi:MoxR-like ATPase